MRRLGKTQMADLLVGQLSDMEAAQMNCVAAIRSLILSVLDHDIRTCRWEPSIDLEAYGFRPAEFENLPGSVKSLLTPVEGRSEAVREFAANAAEFSKMYEKKGLFPDDFYNKSLLLSPLSHFMPQRVAGEIKDSAFAFWLHKDQELCLGVKHLYGTYSVGFIAAGRLFVPAKKHRFRQHCENALLPGELASHYSSGGYGRRKYSKIDKMPHRTVFDAYYKEDRGRLDTKTWFSMQFPDFSQDGEIEIAFSMNKEGSNAWG